MRLPGDNTLVDTDRRALRDWRNYFLSLEPAASLTAAQVTALKALLTVQEEVEADPPSEGSIPYQGPDGATVVEIGTPGQILTVNADATAPEWQDASGCVVLVSNETLPGAATYSVTADIITKPYKSFRIIVADVSRATGGSSGPYSLELSGDGGTTWTASPVAISQSTAASETYDISITVDIAHELTGTRVVTAHSHLTASNWSTPYGDIYTESVTTGYINGLRLSCTSTFDAGTITIIGYN